MNRLFLLASVVLFAVPVYAARDRDKDKDDDQPLQYEEESANPEKRYAPKEKKRKAEHIREEDEEEKAGEETLAHVDDPNIGVGGEVFSGLYLLEASRGSGVDPRFSFGVRFTWEFGRLIPDEYLREMFFADVQWQFAVTSEGTSEVRASSAFHDFTVAPAFCIPFGAKSPISVYGQLGVGFNADFTSIVVDKAETQLTGTKFLFQYGIGLRGRPAVTDDGSVRISFRIEVTRYVRGYMQDTFIGGAVGVIF